MQPQPKNTPYLFTAKLKDVIHGTLATFNAGDTVKAVLKFENSGNYLVENVEGKRVYATADNLEIL